MSQSNQIAATDHPRRMFAVKSYFGIGLLVFALMMLVGVIMRAAQGSIIGDLGPDLFYKLMTLHGAGMVGTAGLAGLAVNWYFLSRHVKLNPMIFLLSLLLSLVAVVMIIGSILLGTKEHIAKALRIRKIFGGAMRQVGFLAAAGIYALDNHVERLAEDHQKAKEIGAVLETVTYVTKVEPIETNIVIFYVDKKIGDANFIDKMATKNILLTPMGEGKIRIVTHLDYTDKMHEILLKELKFF